MEHLRSLKRKWALRQTYKRIRKLWSEYCKVSEFGDASLISTKLSQFLDQFQKAYADIVTSDGLPVGLALDKIAGDCSEILVALVEHVEGTKGKELESLVEVINKALTVAELILRDEKYRLTVKDTPQLINRILSLLETLASTESKKLLLRVITSLAKTGANKLEIGRQEGFKRMLRLIVEGNQGLQQDILSTINAFLENAETTASIEQPGSEVNRFEFMRRKFGGVVTDVGRIFQQVFPSAPEAAAAADEATATAADITVVEPAVAEEEEDHQTEQQQAALLQELMRVQGALSTVYGMLAEAADAVHLNLDDAMSLIDTISRLLSNSQPNQQEFRIMDGYSLFTKLFDRMGNYATSEAKVFLHGVFNILETTIIDGHQDKRVGNVDALTLLLEMIASSAQIDVCLHAISCVQDLIAANPLNMVDVMEVKGAETIIRVLQSVPATERFAVAEDSQRFTDAVFALLNYFALHAGSQAQVAFRTAGGFQVLLAQLRGPDARVSYAALCSLSLMVTNSLDAKRYVHQAVKFTSFLTQVTDTEPLHSEYLSLVLSLADYSVQPDDVRFLFAEATKPGGEQLQIDAADILLRVAARATPANFFSFGSPDGQLLLTHLDKFPAPKTGYTFAAWLCADVFEHNETTLLCWRDAAGAVFELFFKQTSGQDSPRLMQLRMLHAGEPVEVAVFDGCNILAGRWHHVALAHTRKYASLFVDGQLVQKQSVSHYPSNSTKGSLTAGIGGPVAGVVEMFARASGGVANVSALLLEQQQRHFIGQMGAVHFLEGVLEENYAAALYERGSLSEETLKSAGITLKEFCCIHPQTLGSKGSKSVVMLAGNVDAHSTTHIHNVLPQVGGLSLCFALLEKDTERQLLGLKLLNMLVQHSPATMQQFIELKGWSVLSQTLTAQASLLTLDFVPEIFDLLTGDSKDIVRPMCLEVIVSVLLVAPQAVQRVLLSTLVDVISASEANMTHWRAHNGVAVVLNMLAQLLPDFRPCLLDVLNALIPMLTLEETELLLSFLLKRPETGFDVKCDVFNLVCDQASQSPSLVEHLHKLGGCTIALILLDAPVDAICVNALRLLCPLLQVGTKHQAAFAKQQGYDVMVTLLKKRPLSQSICAALMSMTVAQTSRVRPIDAAPADSSTSLLVFPEALSVLLQLLCTTADTEMQVHFLTQIEKLLTPENVALLADGAWVWWFRSFYADCAQHHPDMRILQRLNVILMRLMSRTIAARAPKAIANLRECEECVDFQLYMLQIVITQYMRSAVVEETEAADIAKNVYQLAEMLEEMETASADVYLGIVRTINNFAGQNTASVRAKMKAAELFAIRDRLMVAALRARMTPALLTSLSFESLENPKLCESALLHLLHMLHPVEDDTVMLNAVAAALHGLIMASENSSRMLSKIAQADDFVCVLKEGRRDGGSPPPSPQLDVLLPPCSAPPKRPPSGLLPAAHSSATQFVQWYLSEEAAALRAEIASRVAAKYAATDLAGKKSDEKASARHTKRLRGRAEKMTKHKATIVKAVHEFEERRVKFV